MLDAPLSLGLMFGLFGLLMELAAMALRSRLLRMVCYGSMIVLTAPAITLLLAYDLRLGTLLAAVVGSYRIFNGLRVISGRVKETRLRPASRRTSLFLIVYQLVAVGLWRLGVALDLQVTHVLYGLVVFSLAASLVILLATRRNLRKSHIRLSDKYTPDLELPTVSVCIPARNETDDLAHCLEAVLANDYPKLEVLVLDDCSQDKTSEIIKGFAQKGVRFIRGEEPASGWIAKNQAYQALADAASGQLLLFMGVDVRLSPTTIRSLVGSLSARKKQMISVLPQGLQTGGADVLIQPMRYWWELALPRRMLNRPPVLSTTWIIDRQVLAKLGGFRAVRGSVLPESFFARELVKSDKYSFMRSQGKLRTTTAKLFADQWETAVRTRYAEARQRPENVMLGALLQIWLLGLPMSLFFLGWFVPLGLLWTLSGINALILFWVHYQIVRAWGLTNSVLPVILLPVALALELANLHVSMWKYEFSEVLWKDRNICIPVMQTYPRLPKL